MRGPLGAGYTGAGGARRSARPCRGMSRLRLLILCLLVAPFLVGFLLLDLRGHTRTSASGGGRPTPLRTCRKCHKAIYSEWRSSPHADSFVSRAYEKHDGGHLRPDCDACHAPLSNLRTRLAPRATRQEDGVDCLTCHVLDGRAHGPYRLDAPHRTVKDVRFQDTALCGKCHEEQLAEWETAVARGARETCQDCHMPRIKRGLTQNWTSLFHSRKWTRDHSWSLEPLWDRAARVLARPDGREVLLSVRNVGALHGLPTGTCGVKTAVLTARWRAKGAWHGPAVFSWSSQEGEAIPPGREKHFRLPFDVTRELVRLELTLELVRGEGDEKTRVPLARKGWVFHRGRLLWVEDGRGRASRVDEDVSVAFLPAPGKAAVTLETEDGAGGAVRGDTSAAPVRRPHVGPAGPAGAPPLLPPPSERERSRRNGEGDAGDPSAFLEVEFAGSGSSREETRP